MPNPTSNPTLLSLQVLRAVVALMVVLRHAGHEADLRALRAGAGPLGLDRFFDLGFGVHLFFVISGFIMLRTARGFGTARGALVFMARRVVRVVPLYWLLTTATLLVGLAAPHALNGAAGGPAWVAGSYLFVAAPRGDGTLNPVLGQGWTLDYEMFFYALFALVMPLPRRFALLALASALVGLVALGRLVDPPFAAASVWTDGLLLEFLFGLGLAAAAGRGLHFGRAAAATAILAGAAAAVALGPWTGRFEALSPVLRQGVPAAMIVGGCVLGPRWRAGRALAALAALGDASYSLYLSHPFAVRALGLAWTAASPAVGAELSSGMGRRLGNGAAGVIPTALYLVAACAASAAGALILYRSVERPMVDGLAEALRRRGLAGQSPRPILPRSEPKSEPRPAAPAARRR